MSHSNFENVQPGDKLILQNNSVYGCRRTIVLVDRVTPTLVIIKSPGGTEIRYKKKDGHEQGRSRSYDRLFVPDNEEEIEEVLRTNQEKEERNSLVSCVKNVDWYKVSLSQLQRIKKILDEE